MSQRLFLTTLIWLVLVNLLIKTIFIFGIDLQVQHQVGQSAYGLYFTLLNLCYIFQIINDFGLNLLHNTDTAQHGNIRQAHWKTIVRMKVFLSLTYAIIVFGIAYALGLTTSWTILWWLVINNVLVSWITLLRAGISGMALYKTEAMISVLDKVLMILICGVLFRIMPSFRMEWFVWAQTASLVITAIVAFGFSRKLWLSMVPKETEEASGVLVTFKSTIPFCLATLLMFLYTRSDTILLKKLLPDGEHEVGVFAAGFRLLDAANMIAFLFTPLLIPMYARLQQDQKETAGLIRLATGLMIVLTAVIGIGGYHWASPIMQLCYGRQDHQWVATFSWLILAHVPIGLMYVFSSYLTASSRLKPQNILFAGSVILNIGLNLVLIPAFGTIGAALTAFVTQSVTALGLIFLVHRYLQQPYEIRWVGRILLFFAGLIAGGWLLKTMTMAWWIQLLIFILCCSGAAFVLKLLDYRKMKELLLSKG